MPELATPGERHRLGLSRRATMVCALTFLGGCRGSCQADHILKQQWLEREKSRQELLRRNRLMRQPGADVSDLKLLDVDLDDLLADDRNAWWLCEHGHHAPKDRRTLTIQRAWLPAEFEEFVDELGIDNVAERYFGPR